MGNIIIKVIIIKISTIIVIISIINHHYKLFHIVIIVAFVIGKSYSRQDKGVKNYVRYDNQNSAESGVAPASHSTPIRTKNAKKVTKIDPTTMSNPHAHSHTMRKTHAKFENNWCKTVRGVALRSDTLCLYNQGEK